MRIFIGTAEIAGQIPLFAAGFRALGHEVTTGVYMGHTYSFDTDIAYDMQIALTNPVQARSIIENHDLFLFQFGMSLLWQNVDFKIIHDMGKKIVSLFNGSDVRYWPVYEQQFGINYRALNNEELPDLWSMASLPNTLGTLRRGEMYADLVLSVPNQSVLGLRPYNHFFYPADMRQYTFHVPGRDIPVVVHAPSKLQTKGTARILEALESLRAEGVQFDLRLLHDVPHSEVLAALVDADCIIDQIYLGYGLFAVEGMASGCATATAHFPHLEALASTRPVHPLHVATLKDSLRDLLTNRELRVRLAHEGRPYVEAYHDYVQVCRRILEAVETTNADGYDYYPRFCATAAELPEDVFIPRSLKLLSDAIVAHHGVPYDADIGDMVCRGLLTTSSMQRTIPRWAADVRDCVRYGSVTVPSAPSPTASARVVPSVVIESQALSLLAMCLEDHLPMAEARSMGSMLADGNRKQVALLLHEATQKDPASPALRAALGFLLWGGGMRSTAQTLLSRIGQSDAPWSLLARWLCGYFTLESGIARTALPVLLDVLRDLPLVQRVGIAYVDMAGHASTTGENNDTVIIAESTVLLSWKRPATLPPNCAWVSPAAMAPDWCTPCNPHVLLPIILYQLRCAGYSVHISKSANRSLNILEELLC